MKPNRIYTLLFLFLFTGSAFTGNCQVPAIKVVGAAAKAPQSITLQSLDIDVQVYGNIATTVMTMSFINNTSRILEGELTFPMPDGVSISRYALDINGKMREAVPVEKSRATEVFESIEHRNVDPGLLEKVEGNNFRTRIYPFPAGGVRKVMISYEEELHYAEQQQLRYRLPLDYKTAIPEFSLKATVSSGNQRPSLSGQPDGSFSFNNRGNFDVAEMRKKNFLPARALVINLPQGAVGNSVLMQKAGQSYYFQANVFLKQPARKHHWGSRIGLIWDVSLSGLRRDKEKEIRLLELWIKEQKNLTIELGLLNHTFKKGGVFVIRNGEWKALREKLLGIVYDGGTDYSRINSAALNADEYLFFTDGFSGFGNADVKLNKPVHTINSALRADFSQLKSMSLKSGGQYVNLNEVPVETALRQLSMEELQFIGIKKNPGITEVYPALPVRVNGYLSIAGIASSGSENITLQFGYGKEVTAERNVRLNSAEQNSGAIDVSRLWAQKKLSDLDVDYAQHKEEISSLGRQFGLVTRNTSLLVLESVEDYIRYGITPPAELMAAYRNAIKRQAIAKETRQQDLMKQAIEMAGELKTWWNTVFKAEKVYPTVRKDFLQEGTTAAGSGRRAESVRATAPGYRSPAAATAVSIGDNRSALSEVVVVSNALAGKIAGVSIGKNRVEERPVIIVPEFKSDKDYMKRINGSANQAYAQYLLLRKQYQTTPSFYLDISNWFQQHDDAERALMILSNLTELDLENAEIYKTLTYKLRETGNVHAELFTSKKVLEWRPMDAQSHRDYALALADCGYYQQALATLYNVLNKSYSMDNARRDEGIEEIIIAEINNLISLRSEKLNTAKLNKKILFNFPVDVRVVINWNKKDTDIDLWLTDPTDEKCFYSHPETRAGGRISDDFTAGYGPEQFMIKKAVKGRYKIEVNYYGDQQLSISGATTVMAEIYTHYGSINQQRKVITLQLSGKKADGVFIGEFTF